MEWSGVEWSGVEWSGVEWSGVEWSGVEWSGVEWVSGLVSQWYREWHSQETQALNIVKMRGLRARTVRLRNSQSLEETLTPESISEYSGCVTIFVVC